MIPYFQIGSFKLHTFGLMMALAFLSAVLIATKRFRTLGLDPDRASELGLGAMVGGVSGAKIYFLLDHWSEFAADPFHMAFSGSGLTWYGGLIGGVIGTLLVAHWRKIPLLWLCDFAAPLVSLSYAIGRIGCFLNGDDYGRPTNLPWAMAFPKGTPATTTLVHPTQLYEVLSGTIIALLLFRLPSDRFGSGAVFGLYLMLTGLARFFVEFYRTNEPVAMGLTVAQLISLGLFVGGLALLVRARSAAARMPVIATSAGNEA